MDANALFIVAVLAGVLAVAIDRFLRPTGLFSGGAGRIPKKFVVQEIPIADLPSGARKPFDFLSDKLQKLGFERVDLPVRVGFEVLLVPFIHPEERALFLMGVEARWTQQRPELMLHILTPLSGARRVETTTLPALGHLRPPANVDLRVVLDAESVEEIWSRHRRALTTYQRAEREVISVQTWKSLVAQAYEAWLEMAVRAQRLRLSKDGSTYHLRAPS